MDPTNTGQKYNSSKKSELLGLAIGSIIGLGVTSFLFIAIAVGGGLAAQNNTEGLQIFIVAIATSLGVGTLVSSVIAKSIAKNVRHAFIKSFCILVVSSLAVYFINVLVNPSFR